MPAIGYLNISVLELSSSLDIHNTVNLSLLFTEVKGGSGKQNLEHNCKQADNTIKYICLFTLMAVTSYKGLNFI